jgi:hypothetical protein
MGFFPTLFGIPKKIYEKLNLVEIEKLFQVACTLLFMRKSCSSKIIFLSIFFKAYYDDELCVFEVGDCMYYTI